MFERYVEAMISMQALVTRREAMMAENMQRVMNNQALAYDDTAFYEIADEFEALIRRLHD